MRLRGANTSRTERDQKRWGAPGSRTKDVERGGSKIHLRARADWRSFIIAEHARRAWGVNS